VEKDVADAPPGLRERKKQRTRATLVDAAIELCLKQGYDQTTVEQIAAAADVSPRTFSRYFPTKDAVFMTLIMDYSDAVAHELEAVPLEVGPLEALRSAHVAALTRVAGRPFSGRITNDRIVLMLRVINASDTLLQAAFDFKHPPTEVCLAKRMGVRAGDRRLRLVGAIFGATMVTACGDLIADVDGITLGPNVMIERLNEAFDQVAVWAAELNGPVPGTESVTG
jgi:AcrR family transcriptional regulator